MISFTTLYSNDGDKKFDLEYYSKNHVLMIQQKLGAALKGHSIEVGISGMEPGSIANHIVIAHFYYESIEAFQTAIAPHMQTIKEDLSNYTDIVPTFQFSKVLTKSL